MTQDTIDQFCKEVAKMMEKLDFSRRAYEDVKAELHAVKQERDELRKLIVEQVKEEEA